MTDVYYAVRPGSITDEKVSSNITVTTGGVGTFDTPQTGDIGQGWEVVYNGITSYISQYNSSTEVLLIDAVGAQAANQTITTLTSIQPVWASLSAAEAAYLGASFLNTTDLVTNTLNPFFMCYKNGTTADSTNVLVDGATMNSTHFLTIKTPEAGIESANIQRANFTSFDTAFYHLQNSSEHVIRNNDEFLEVEGLQIEFNGTGLRQGVFGSVGTTNVIKSYILASSTSTRGGVSTNATLNITNSVLRHSAGTAGSRGGECFGSGVLNMNYCIINGYDDGVNRSGGTATLKNLIIFNCTDDFNGTITSTDCATDDNDNSGTGDFQLHSTYADVFVDHVNGDFTLKDYTSTGAVIEQATPIGGITDDIIGTTRDVTNPDVGAFEFLSSGAALVKSVADSIGLTDSVNNILSLVRSNLESVGVTDTTVKKVGLFRSISDSIGITDLAAKTVILIKSISDSVGVTDLVSRALNFKRQVLDSVGLTDTVSRSGLAIIKSIAESIGITDIVIKTLNPLARVFNKIKVLIFGHPRLIIEVFGDPETEIDIYGNPETTIKIYGDP